MSEDNLSLKGGLASSIIENPSVVINTVSQENKPINIPETGLKNLDSTGHVIGSMGEHIGTGPHAQNNITLLVIQYSFLSGAIATAYFLVVFLVKNSPDLLESIKTIWAIFTPIITLGLGYIFGKGKD